MPRERSLTSRERGVRASAVMGRGLEYLNCTPPALREVGAYSRVLDRPPPPQPSSRNKESAYCFLPLPQLERVPPSVEAGPDLPRSFPEVPARVCTLGDLDWGLAAQEPPGMRGRGVPHLYPRPPHLRPLCPPFLAPPLLALQKRGRRGAWLLQGGFPQIP